MCYKKLRMRQGNEVTYIYKISVLGFTMRFKVRREIK